MNNAKTVACGICPHDCMIQPGESGICGVRRNVDGLIVSESYGRVTSIALDPIEKKPLRMFHEGAMILSIGSYGCNLRCPFCQNHEIAMPRGEVRTSTSTPQEILALAQAAVSQGNIGVAYTYNEPLIGYEFVYDCARLIKSAGLKNVVVTNGFIREKPLEKLLPFIDAMNIDLKGFSEEFYKKIGGSLEPVKATIKRAAEVCHVEVTTLVIPGENERDIEPIAAWLASVNPAIPLHLSRFFPRHEYSGREATTRETILKLAEAAKGHLKFVFTTTY
ncbi:MAG: AmmeMemoRadiSam system radical SAM enzyme [Defluviitaleaceae bacterium]|nr:AmmeMemoRadiSam system radical SAM enzyme [Defluviitaleaceae bacterium]